MAGVVLLDVVRSVLKLETSSTEADLQESLTGLTVRHLKVLCSELQVKTSGTKAVLIGELVTFWKRQNVGESSAGRQISCASTVDIKTVTGWTKDLSLLRDFTFMHVYDYLINSQEKEFDRESLKAFKSLKAYKYFADGLVTNVSVAELDSEFPAKEDDKEVIAVKCCCFSSLKAKTTYDVSLVMEKNGNVLAAKCTCVAGKGAACSHCAALMFYLEHLKRQGMASIPSDKTVTDQLQQWHVPSKRSIQPQPVKDIQFNKREYGKNVKAGTSSQKKAYDPRHTCDRTLDREQMDTLVSRIVAACPASGIKHFWVDRADFVEGAMPESLSASQSLEPLIIYQASKPSCLPDTVVDLADIDPGCTVFKELCYLYEEQQVLSEELSSQIEMLTVTQRQCDLWHDLHNGRITSSKFGQIVHRRETTDTRSIVGQLMGYDSSPSSLPQLQWGIQSEPVALACYTQYMGSKVTVKPSGLTLMPSHSYLGASADGIITHADRPSNPGVLEIKCPFSVHGESVRTMPPLDIAKRYPSFHLDRDGHLKKEHNYYYQVQGEMAVKGCKWAHFTTWTHATNNNIVVEEIKFDAELWHSTILPKLQQFYVDTLAPEILLRKLQPLHA